MRKPFAILLIGLLGVGILYGALATLQKKAAALHSKPGALVSPETKPATLADRVALARGGYNSLRAINTLALRGKLTVGGQSQSLTSYVDCLSATPKFYLYTETPDAHRALSLFENRAFEIVRPGAAPLTTPVDKNTQSDLETKSAAFRTIARFPFGDAWTEIDANQLKRERDGWIIQINEKQQIVALDFGAAAGHERWVFEGRVMAAGVPFPKLIRAMAGDRELWNLQIETWTGHALIPDDTYRGIPTGGATFKPWNDAGTRSETDSDPPAGPKK